MENKKNALYTILFTGGLRVLGLLALLIVLVMIVKFVFGL